MAPPAVLPLVEPIVPAVLPLVERVAPEAPAAEPLVSPEPLMAPVPVAALPVPVVSALDAVEEPAMPALVPLSVLVPLPQPPSSAVPSTATARNTWGFFIKKLLKKMKDTMERVASNIRALPARQPT